MNLLGDDERRTRLKEEATAKVDSNMAAEIPAKIASHIFPSKQNPTASSRGRVEKIESQKTMMGDTQVPEKSTKHNNRTRMLISIYSFLVCSIDDLWILMIRFDVQSLDTFNCSRCTLNDVSES